MDADDITLLRRWREGDEMSGQTLFARHFDSIYGFFETKCPAEADELVQSTFYECVRARDQFRAESSFRTYLFTIARHALYRLLRTRQRKDSKLDFEVSSIADLGTTPTKRIAKSQDRQSLLEALQRLPVEQQTLLELHYWEDMQIAQLAEVFDVTAAAMRTRLHRARTALREAMESRAPANVLESLETMDQWARGSK